MRGVKSIWGSPPTGIFFRLNVNQAVGFTCSVGVMIIVIPFPQWGKASTVTKVVMVATDTPNLGIRVSPKIWVLLLLPKLRVVSEFHGRVADLQLPH